MGINSRGVGKRRIRGELVADSNIWETRDGRWIPIPLLETEHLIAIIRMLRRRASPPPKNCNVMDDAGNLWPIYKVLLREAWNRRIDISA
jgi:hypothetical protein